MDSKNIINVIPTYASVEESALYVIESMESNFNAMMESVGIEELQTFEESGDILLEAEHKNKVIDSIVTWLKETWEKVRGLFEKALKAIKDQIDKTVSKVGKASKDKCKKMADRLKADKVYGKGFEWSGFADIIEGNGEIWNAVRGFEDAITGVKADYNYDPNNLMKIKDQLDTAKDKMEEKIISKSDGKKDIQSAVSRIIKGKEIDINKDYIVKNFDELWNYGTDFGKTANTVKKSLNKTKKSFDDTEKYFRGLARQKDENAAIIKEVIKYVKASKSTLISLDGAILSCVKTRCYEATRIILRLVVAVKQKEEKEAKAETKTTNESAVIEPTSFQTELASLFNF